MNQIDNEECVVCFRVYCDILVPVNLSCGHTFCQECSDNLDKCPICRKKQRAGRERPTNYSLLSLVSRVTEAGTARKETRDEETQTDKQPRKKSTIVPEGMEAVKYLLGVNIIMRLNRIQNQLMKMLQDHLKNRSN